MTRILSMVVLAVMSVLSLSARSCSLVLSGGVGHPWGLAFDAHGSLWFAEAGCELAPACSPGSPPGELGVFPNGSLIPQYFPLPNIPGNQPAFVTTDDAGEVWFTTPANDKIGEFDPSTATFVGQWPVSPGSGPWDIVFGSGAIWYTENLASAIGRFDKLTHTYTDFPTPSANSRPYGIALGGPGQSDLIWFTENNNSVARIGVLDTSDGNRISEYSVRESPPPALTPHLITVDARGHVWWTEGWTRAIGELDPNLATPGTCGVQLGSCRGVTEHFLPPPPASCPQTHVSGIAADGERERIWLDDSLSSEVGYFDTESSSFTLYDTRYCGDHPHDGLTLDRGGHPWWSDEFANIIECCPSTDGTH